MINFREKWEVRGKREGKYFLLLTHNPTDSMLQLLVLLLVGIREKRIRREKKVKNQPVIASKLASASHGQRSPTTRQEVRV